MELQEALEHTYECRWKDHKDGDKSCRRASLVVSYLGPTADVRWVSTANILQIVIPALRIQGMAPGTINRHLSALSAVLRMAEELGEVGRAPRVPKMREPKGRLVYLKENQEPGLLEALPEPINWVCEVLIDTGLRLSELLRLRVDEYTTDRLTVSESKNDRPRVVPLTRRAYDALEMLRNYNAGERVCQGVTESMIGHAFRKARKDPELVVHSLRHTCASRLIQRGVELPVVQRWLGHANIQTTMRYVHFGDKQVFDAVSVLEVI